MIIMARNKNLSVKLRRGKNLKQNKSVPNWVMIKTRRKVSTNPTSRRSWRNNKLKRD